MSALDPVAQARVERVLSFLAVAGGAALLSRRPFEVLAIAGEIERELLTAAARIPIATPGLVVHAGPEALIIDLDEDHRLYVRVPAEPKDRTFADRTLRAAGLLKRFAFSVPSAPPAPPSPASANAVVFAPTRRRPAD